ncbi:MAG: protein phosphatase 2C domain-containing protein [Patescibacteria group bacterium]|jgi:hypothetical protein
MSEIGEPKIVATGETEKEKSFVLAEIRIPESEERFSQIIETTCGQACLSTEIGANHLFDGKKNQDNGAIINTQDGAVLIVADGVGGHSSGEKASAMAVDIVAKEVGRDWSASAAMQKAHTELAVLRDSATQHMARPRNPASTMVCAEIRGRDLEVNWAGDSIALVVRSGKIIFATVPHSWKQEFGERSNAITSSIGGPKNRISKRTFDGLQNGDIVVLMTDGISKTFDMDTIPMKDGEVDLDALNDRDNEDFIFVIVNEETKMETMLFDPDNQEPTLGDNHDDSTMAMLRVKFPEEDK